MQNRSRHGHTENTAHSTHTTQPVNKHTQRRRICVYAQRQTHTHTSTHTHTHRHTHTSVMLSTQTISSTNTPLWTRGLQPGAALSQPGSHSPSPTTSIPLITPTHTHTHTHSH